MGKHTPGPWKVGHTETSTSEIEVVSEARPFICMVLPGAIEGVTEANARLIAAAPELLDVVMRLHALVKGEAPGLLSEDSGGDGQLDLDVIAAIAKATGESHW